MNADRIREEIAKLNKTQRAAVRRYVAAVKPGDSVAVHKAEKGAHVYVRRSNEMTSLLLGPRGRVLEAKLRTLAA